jgi:hypothetical protein
VNELLAKKARFIDISKMSGFSKSAIGRHSQKCLSRQVLRDYRDLRTPHTRYIVRQPNGELFHVDVRIPSSSLRDDDVILQVSFELPPTPDTARNPAALARLEAAKTSEPQT